MRYLKDIIQNKLVASVVFRAALRMLSSIFVPRDLKDSDKVSMYVSNGNLCLLLSLRSESRFVFLRSWPVLMGLDSDVAPQEKAMAA